MAKWIVMKQELPSHNGDVFASWSTLHLSFEKASHSFFGDEEFSMPDTMSREYNMLNETEAGTMIE